MRCSSIPLACYDPAAQSERPKAARQRHKVQMPPGKGNGCARLSPALRGQGELTLTSRRQCASREEEKVKVDMEFLVFVERQKGKLDAAVGTEQCWATRR